MTEKQSSPAPYLFLVAIVIVGGLFVEYFDRARLKEQRELITQVGRLNAADIRSVKIIPKFGWHYTDVCLTVEDSKFLAELAAFLKRADDTYYGGHQSPLFPLKLHFELVGGEEIAYLVRNFERFPDDMYLNLYAYESYPGGSFSYKVEPQIRVPGLYPWLKSRVDKAGCNPTGRLGQK